MKRLLVALTLILAIASSGLAIDRACTPSNFSTQFAAAAQGDRLILAPGTYGHYWLAGKSGAAGNLIQVLAQDPNNRPVFDAGGASECLQIASCSYILFDGLIVRNVVDEGIHVQDAGSGPSNHIVFRNTTVTMNAGGTNTDNWKCDYTSDVLFFNCTANVNADAAFDMMGVNGQLVMRSYSSANCFAHAKNGSHNVGYYKNFMNNTGERNFQFGGNGLYNYDQIAMGNVLVGASPQSAVYTTARFDEFKYNTIQNLNAGGAVIRILNEGAATPPTGNNTFSNNLVQYTGSALAWPGGNTDPASFTVANNFWSKTPDFMGYMTETGGVVGTPDLNADYRPLNTAAKDYGAHAPGMEAAWSAYTSRFAWAWSYASTYDSNAAAGTKYKVYKRGSLGGNLMLNGTASSAGNNPNAGMNANYHQNVISAYNWDINGDNVFTDATGGTPTLTYAQLVALGRGAAGTYQIELEITAHTDYGDMKDWGTGSLVVAEAHDGDASFDGRVNVDDLGLLASNYDGSGKNWAQADFSGDGMVNVDDLGVLASNYDWVDASGSEVPEPASLGLLLLGGLAALRRRK